jgi:hypothetical protein
MHAARCSTANHQSIRHAVFDLARALVPSDKLKIADATNGTGKTTILLMRTGESRVWSASFSRGVPGEVTPRLSVRFIRHRYQDYSPADAVAENHEPERMARGRRPECDQAAESFAFGPFDRVSYNKFLAKVASDCRKPDGLFVITPKMGPAFVENLPVNKFHGIGPATTVIMNRLGIKTGLDLRAQALPCLSSTSANPVPTITGSRAVSMNGRSTPTASASRSGRRTPSRRACTPSRRCAKRGCQSSPRSGGIATRCHPEGEVRRLSADHTKPVRRRRDRQSC